MQSKQSKGNKRKKLRKAMKSTGRRVRAAGRRVRDFTKSRIVKRFIPLFGLVAIFKPSGPVHALTIDADGLGALGEFGRNGTFFYIGYEGTRRVTRNGISAIPDPTTRAVVSTVGSVASMAGGVACGIGSAVCASMGWEQKAVICTQGLGICAGVATGMHEGDPGNVATIPGKLAGEAAAAAAALTGSA